MNFFDDLSTRGPVYKQLEENGLIRKAFNPDAIRELIDWGWYEELYADDEPDFDQLATLPIFVVYLNEYKKEAMQSVIDAYEPLAAVKSAGHFFDFLVINTELKLVCGLGLGRKNRFFSYMSANGSEFDNKDSASEQLLRESMPWDFLTKLQQKLEELGQEMFGQDNIPGNPEMLQIALDSGPNDEGNYCLEDDDEEMTEEELRGYIYDHEIHDENIDDLGSMLKVFFADLDVYELNTGDY